MGTQGCVRAAAPAGHLSRIGLGRRVRLRSHTRAVQQHEQVDTRPAASASCRTTSVQRSLVPLVTIGQWLRNPHVDRTAVLPAPSPVWTWIPAVLIVGHRGLCRRLESPRARG